MWVLGFGTGSTTINLTVNAIDRAERSLVAQRLPDVFGIVREEN